MKNYAIKCSFITLALLVSALIFTGCGSNASPVSTPTTSGPASTDIPEIAPSSTRTPHPTSSATRTPQPANTSTPEATATSPDPTKTPTLGELLKTHIVFYLIVPEKGRKDACGDISTIPIISKRMRTGDKLYDVQVALNMLFSMKTKIYVQWYNALWDTDLTIESYQYNAQKDYMTIHFAGYLPAGNLSNCDKHGIREQIWDTFFHYGIKEKTFKINGKFLIDELNRKGKK